MKIIEYKYTRVDGKFNVEVIEPSKSKAILRKVVVYLFKKFNYEHFRDDHIKDIITIKGLRTCLIETKSGTRSTCGFMHKIGKYHI